MLGIGAAVAVVAFYGLFGCQVSTVAPDSAPIVLNTTNVTYATPPCVAAGNVSPGFRGGELVTVSNGALRARFRARTSPRYRPDPVCRDGDGFMDTRSLFFSLINPRGNRWAPDGRWNW